MANGACPVDGCAREAVALAWIAVGDAQWEQGVRGCLIHLHILVGRVAARIDHEQNRAHAREAEAGMVALTSEEQAAARRTYGTLWPNLTERAKDEMFPATGRGQG